MQFKWSDSNEGVLRIPQSSSITENSQSDCLVPYPKRSLGERFYSYAEKKSVYFTAPADWAILLLRKFHTPQNNHCFHLYIHAIKFSEIISVTDTALLS